MIVLRAVPANNAHQDFCVSLVPCLARFVTAAVNDRLLYQLPNYRVILSERSESKDPLFVVTDSSTSPLCGFAQNDMRFRFLLR